MSEFIPLSVPNFIGNELKYVTDAVNSEWVSTGGAKITEFENNIANYTGANFAIACQSGTSGLHLALLECGVGEGDLVIAPTLTFIAAVNPIVYCKAQPIFMDCNDYLCLDTHKLESFLKHECVLNKGVTVHSLTKKVVKAILAVHVFGNMCNMQKIMELAKIYNLKVIEDATEALGTYYTSGIYKGKHAGTIGDYGVYSFNGNKIITTGGGGMVVTNHKEHANHIKYISQQAKDDAVRFYHSEIGYNYRMTNLQAALGVAQLEQLEKFIQNKNDNYNFYLKQGIDLLPFQSDIRSNKWFYSYLAKGEPDRECLMQFLSEKRIQSRPIWCLIHALPMYKDCIAYSIEKAVHYQNNVLNIPCSSSLTKDMLNTVAEVIKEYEDK